MAWNDNGMSTVLSSFQFIKKDLKLGLKYKYCIFAHRKERCLSG